MLYTEKKNVKKSFKFTGDYNELVDFIGDKQLTLSFWNERAYVKLDKVEYPLDHVYLIHEDTHICVVPEDIFLEDNFII